MNYQMQNNKYCNRIFNNSELIPSDYLSDYLKNMDIMAEKVENIYEADFLLIFLWPYQIINSFVFRKVFDALHNEIFFKNNPCKPVLFVSMLKLDFVLAEIFNKKNNEEISEKDDTTKITQAVVKKYPYTSALFNPNCWIRYFDFKEMNPVSMKKYFDELEFFKTNIFDRSNAIEGYEYFLRTQDNNWLNKSLSGHGKHVYPNIYSNEIQKFEETDIYDNLKFFLPQVQDDEKEIRGIYLRILLIDDKIYPKETEKKECKADLIKSLLQGEFAYNENIKEKVCWLTPFLGHPETIEIANFDEDFFKDGDLDKAVEKINTLNKYKIQIIAVKSIEKARQLLACEQLRFDLIMMDYLLAEKNDGSILREYATEFWGDGEIKYFEDQSSYYDLYSKIKANRGPMNKLWIFPITAFNQTFIDDLRNRGIRLIDYYWYLSRGADPINTPYLFIYTLNKFLQLMLDEAIFSLRNLYDFINKSIEKFKQLEKNANAEKVKILMTTEYIYFINQYAMREQIERDIEAGSLFAKYIKDSFLEKRKDLTKISDSIRRFYHSLAYGEDRDYLKAQERLFRMLDFFKNKTGTPKADEIDSVTLIRTILNNWENDFNTIIQQRFDSKS